MRASSRETELALAEGHKTAPGKPGLRHLPEALDLDFLATGDVGHDYCKGPCMSLFAEADREVLAEVHRAVPHARGIDAQLVDEVPDRLDLRRIGGRDWGVAGLARVHAGRQQRREDFRSSGDTVAGGLCR